MMGEDVQSDSKHIGAAVYTNRSYGHEQLDAAADQMEVELLEKDAEGPTPYWVWLFIFFNVISFGMALAVVSLTYFSLLDSKTKPATLKIATYQGKEFRPPADHDEDQEQEDNELREAGLTVVWRPSEEYFLVVTEAKHTAEFKKDPQTGNWTPAQTSDDTGMDFSQKVDAGTYCTIARWNRLNRDGEVMNIPDFTMITPLPGQNIQEGTYIIPSMAVVPITPAQVDLLDRISDPNLSSSERPITDNAKFAFYTGLKTFCAVQFWLGMIYYVIAHIAVALQAIKDEMVHAVLASILPIYNVVWCFMRWKYVGGQGIMALLGILMIVAGMVISLFVPDLLPTAAGSTE
jgi:hypothetical protein